MSAPKFTPIPEWKGYAATPDGRIWSVSSNWRGYGAREMRQTPNGDGYPSVRLISAKGVRRRITVHKLIAITFLGPRPEGCDQIRHLDGERSNPSADNLAWGTAAENAADRTAHGRAAKITPEKRLKMADGCRRYHRERRAQHA